MNLQQCTEDLSMFRY